MILFKENIKTNGIFIVEQDKFSIIVNMKKEKIRKLGSCRSHNSQDTDKGCHLLWGRHNLKKRFRPPDLDISKTKLSRD